MIMEEPQYDSPLQMKIQVAVRKRPINKKEVAKGDIDIIAVKDIHTLTVREMKFNKFINNKIKFVYLGKK